MGSHNNGQRWTSLEKWTNHDVKTCFSSPPHSFKYEESNSIALFSRWVKLNEPLLPDAFFFGDESDDSFPSFFRFFPPEAFFLDAPLDAFSDGFAFAAFFPRTGSILEKNPTTFSM